MCVHSFKPVFFILMQHSVFLDQTLSAKDILIWLNFPALLSKSSPNVSDCEGISCALPFLHISTHISCQTKFWALTCLFQYLIKFSFIFSVPAGFVPKLTVLELCIILFTLTKFVNKEIGKQPQSLMLPLSCFIVVILLLWYCGKLFLCCV